MVKRIRVDSKRMVNMMKITLTNYSQHPHPSPLNPAVDRQLNHGVYFKHVESTSDEQRVRVTSLRGMHLLGLDLIHVGWTKTVISKWPVTRQQPDIANCFKKIKRIICFKSDLKPTFFGHLG